MATLYPQQLELVVPGVKEKRLAKLLYTPEQIQQAVKSIRIALLVPLATERPLLLGVAQGGLRLLYTLLDSLWHTELDYAVVMPTPRVRILSVRDQYVIFIDDIWHTGATLKRLEREANFSGAREVRTVALVGHTDKGEGSCNVIGLKLPPNTGWLVGYGMDYYGRYRHLNAIYEVEDKEWSPKSGK